MNENFVIPRKVVSQEPFNSVEDNNRHAKLVDAAVRLGRGIVAQNLVQRARKKADAELLRKLRASLGTVTANETAIDEWHGACNRAHEVCTDAAIDAELLHRFRL